MTGVGKVSRWEFMLLVVDGLLQEFQASEESERRTCWADYHRLHGTARHSVTQQRNRTCARPAVPAAVSEEPQERVAVPPPPATPAASLGHVMTQRMVGGKAVKRRCVMCAKAGRDTRTSNHCVDASCAGVHLCHPTRSHMRRTCWADFHRLSATARRSFTKQRKRARPVATPLARSVRQRL